MKLFMSKSIIIIGSGGHSRSVISLLKGSGFNLTAVYDNSWNKSKNELILGVPLVGSIDHVPPDESICLAIGDNRLRSELLGKFSNQIYSGIVKHFSAYIDGSATFGKYNLVFANAFINAEAQIGNNNILNTGCLIEHECLIGNHNHISVAAVVCGRVSIEDYCFVGAGAIIKDKIKICSNVTIGAGAVVIKDIFEPGVYVGNPAKKIK